MRFMKAVLPVLAVIGSSWSLAAGAGNVTGTVSHVLVRQSDGLTYFYIAGTATGKPSCATNTYWIVMNENSTAGKGILALMMAGQASGKTVSIYGNNTCTRWPDGEDIQFVDVAS
jgi:hypothetical protein